MLLVQIIAQWGDVHQGSRNVRQVTSEFSAVLCPVLNPTDRFAFTSREVCLTLFQRFIYFPFLFRFSCRLKQEIAQGVRSISGLSLVGEPKAMIVCFRGGQGVNIYKVVSAVPIPAHATEFFRLRSRSFRHQHSTLAVAMKETSRVGRIEILCSVSRFRGHRFTNRPEEFRSRWVPKRAPEGRRRGAPDVLVVLIESCHQTAPKCRSVPPAWGVGDGAFPARKKRVFQGLITKADTAKRPESDCAHPFCHHLRNQHVARTGIQGDRMSHRGWSLNALQHPPCLHLCVTMCHVGKAGEFLADLLASTLEAGASAGEVCENSGIAFFCFEGVRWRGENSIHPWLL